MRSLKSQFCRFFHWPWFSSKHKADYRRVMHSTRRRLAQEPLESRTLLSISPTMINLDSAIAANPSNFVQVGEICYFTADTTDYGRELWATDGTEDGTHLVKDINDGSDSSGPSKLIEFNGKLYFTADDGENGVELWMSDGTESGTVLVKNINSEGALGSSPGNLTVVGGVLYFCAEDADHGVELWMSDGTESGTVLVKDIYTGTSTSGGVTTPNSSSPLGLVDVDGTLFFVAENGSNGLELWKSDGTANGTVLVTDINEGGGDAFDVDDVALVAVDDTLFFVADDGEHGYELWTSDGTESGTTMIKDLYSGSNDAFSIGSLQLVAMDGILYFAADDGASGDELWRSDGTSSGTYLVKDINEGSDGNLSTYTSFTIVDDVLYFSADDGEHGKELWKTDGTESGTVLVKDIASGSDNSYPFYMTALDGVLYFSAYSDDYGREIWKSDGTEAGTVLVSDGIVGATGIAPTSLQVIGEYLIFIGDVNSEHELYSLNLTAANQQNARLSIWVDGEQVDIPTDVGVYSDQNKAAVYTVNSKGEIIFDDNAGTTLGEFFEIWRTNAGNAGNNAAATFGSHELMDQESDSSYTVQMFVNGEVCTDFENYVIQDDDEIVLIYSDNPVVSINTNYGSIIIELFEEDTPITVENFLSYINGGDYINSIFHRSDPGFVIQGGGFTTSSSTFSSTSQFTSIGSHGAIENESLLPNDYGTVAMARTGNVDSATSQFFINLDDNDNLDNPNNPYAVFGHVLDMTAVKIIQSLPIDNNNAAPFAELPCSSSDQLVVVESLEGVGDITGYKFYDTDLDGVFDSNEVGVEGVTVFIDANGNGQLDDGETWATTDSDGKYLLQAKSGTYTVCAESTSGSMATVESVDVTVQIGLRTSDANLGESNLLAPTGIDLIDESDTGSYNDDNLTNRNNADSDATLQFLVSGVNDGAVVHIYCDGVEIGSGTASNSTVTITTNGETAITDGDHVFTATQEVGSSESDASDSLTLTIDATPPAAIQTTAPDIAEILVDYVFDADSPDEGEDGVFYSLSGAPDGMTIDADTGEISWTPTAEQDVPQLFDIIVSDAAGNESIQSVNMTVLGVIHAYPDSYTVEEDSQLIVEAGESSLLYNDDPDGEFGTLEAFRFSQPAHGEVTIEKDGSFRYTPEEDFFGIDTFTYYVKCGEDESNVVMVTIEVTNVQDAPVGEEDEYWVDEDTDLVVDAATGLLFNDSDPDGDTLTATIVGSPQHGEITSFDPETGAFTYEPDPNYSGIDTFTYTLSDGTDTTDPITVTINVEGVNDDPVVEDDTYTMDEDDTLSVDASEGILHNDSDLDGDTLTATIVGSPQHGEITEFNATTGAFTYEPDPNFAGTDTFTYTVSDGTTVSEEVTVTITVLNVQDEPIAEDDEFDVDNDSAHKLDVLDNDDDPDASDIITIVSVTQGSKGGTVSIIDGDEILYMPKSGYTGTETFTYTIQDKDGNAVTATVTMTVEEGDNDDNPETGNSSLSGYVYVDVDGDGHFDSDEIGLPGVLVTLTGTSDTGNSITWKQLTDNDGHYSFDDLPAGTYKITESQPEIMIDGTDTTPITGASVSGDAISGILLDDDESFENSNFGERHIQTGYVTIRMFFASTSTSLQEYLRTLVAYGEDRAGNSDLADAIRDGITDYDSDPGDNTNDNTAPEGEDDSSYTVTEDTTLTVNASQGVLDNDTDDDNDTLIASLLSGPANGTISLNSDGSFEYIPDEHFNGTDTFTYVVYDGTTISNTVTVTITVSAVNDPPVANPDQYLADENTTLTITTDGVLDNDTDPENSTLTAKVATHPEHGTLSLGTDGLFTYTPDVNFVGTDTFTYYVSDGTLDSDPVTVTIIVEEGEDVPVAVEDEYEVDEDNSLVVDAATGILSNDYDDDGDPLEIHIATGPQHGTLSMEDDGSFTYIPAENYYGTDTFTYYLTDNLFESEEVTVTIEIYPVNDAPVGEEDTYTTLPNTQLNVDVANGVLSNDDDVDSSTLTAELVSGGGVTHGELTWSDSNDGSFTYTPTSGYHGIDSFTYKVSDGNLYSEEITVYIHVNTPANAQADAYEVDEDNVLNVGVDNGLLDNDTDADGDPLEVEITADPEHGTLVPNKNGSFTYTPDPNFYGTDTFTYVAEDGYANPTEVTVTIIVRPVNDAPLGDADTYSVDEDSELSLSTEDLLENDSDPDGNDLEVVIDSISDPANGTITWIDQENGLFKYTPDPNFYGTDSFTYYVTDGELNSDPITVTITVEPVNDAPLAVANEYSVDEDGELIVSTEDGLLKNDSDIDSENLYAIFVDGPSHGTLTWFENDGSFKYTPNPGFHGTDSFTYYTTDDDLDSATVTVTITVNSVNDLPVATADEVALAEVQATDIDVLANDTDADDDDTLTIDSFDATSAQGATITLNMDGTLHYDPSTSTSLTEGTATSDTFTYTITDGHTGVAVTGTVTIDIGTTYITLDGNSITVDGTGAMIDGSTLTITSAGKYNISGTLNDGRILIDTSDEEEVILILNGVNITCSDNAPIYIVNASTTVITLAADTENYITDGTTYTGTGGPDAAIYCNGDLVIEGNGSLTVSANYNDGIACLEDLDIHGGNIMVTAVNHGIRGKDSVVIFGGTVTVDAGGDGIQSHNSEDVTKGYVTIEGGTLYITTDSDGIQAETTLTISGGDVTIFADGQGLKSTANITIENDTVSIDINSTEDAIHAGGTVTISGGDLTIDAGADGIMAEDELLISGGTINITTGDGNTETVGDGESAKALKADVAITVTGGTITIDSADDAIYSDDTVTISGGDITITSGGNGIHAENSVTIDGGDIDITKSYEGIESNVVTINDGTIHLVSSDDGINIAGGVDSSGSEFTENSNAHFTLTGGYVFIDAQGDGCDAKGSVTIGGGTLIISGATGDTNGELNYDGTFEVTGGFLLAIGSPGMVESPSESSTQETLAYSYDSMQSAGVMIHIQTQGGEEILTFVPTKDYQSIVLYSADLETGTTYVVYSGGSSTGTETDGLYTDGTYTPGTQVDTVTIS